LEPVVRLRSAVCLLGRFPALAGVDLDVLPEEVVLLSGGNGAGKTTLLRLLAGLVPLHAGSGEVLGVDLAIDRRSHRRLVGLVGHETGCYDDLTVEENLRFSARAAAVAEPDLSSILGRLGLGPLRGVVHRKLSTGQQRRLTLAMAMVRRPRLLLLDEPHAGLDADGRAALDVMLAAAARSGQSVVLASHELERTRPMVTREVVLTAGQAHGAVDAPTVADGPQAAPAPKGAAARAGDRSLR
jgi:ABC-type multidrug transport system ATPase subunit